MPIVILFFSLLLLSNCGIPIYSYMEAPITESVAGEENTFRLTYTQEPGISFYGFDFYYKIYPEGDAAISTDSSYIVPEDTVSQMGRTRLDDKNFLMLTPYLENKEGQPGTEWECILRIDQQTGEATLNVEKGASIDPFLLYRQINEISIETELTGFGKNEFDLENDYDITIGGLFGDFDPAGTDKITIVVFVIAHGMDTNSLLNVTSEPVKLGEYVEYDID